LISEFKVGEAMILVQPTNGMRWFAAIVSKNVFIDYDLIESIHKLLTSLEILSESSVSSSWVRKTIDAIDDLVHDLITG